HAKIKIGGAPLDVDCRRIEVAAAQLSGTGHLAVDAMNLYDQTTALQAAIVLEPYALWWFEDLCDPLDFATHAKVAEV
ncbi:enolase C-terminal domain-like protein, partial [Acinetobacter baumannii]